MINTERTLNIFTSVFHDALLSSKYQNLTQREKDIISTAKEELDSLTFNDETNMSSGFFNSKPSDIIPVLFISLFTFKKQYNSANISFINLLTALREVLTQYIDGSLDTKSKEFGEVVDFLNYTNLEYQKRIYLSNIHSDLFSYA